MSYFVSKERLENRFREWKYAMLVDIHHSLAVSRDEIDPEAYEIDSVIKYYILISGLTGLLHTRFRGEAKHYPNPCLPIIAREEGRGYDTNYELTEISRFKNSDVGRLFLKNVPANDTTWWMLTQHYQGYNTRLLDITRNPLIALYFACEKYPDEDGYVYVFHSTNKTSMPLNRTYHGYLGHILDEENYYEENTFVYMRPNFALDRINRQEGEFLWVKNYHDLRERGLYETEQIIPIRIKKENKHKLLQELREPQGITWEFLNPKPDWGTRIDT